MQADKRPDLAEKDRRNYKNVLNAFSRIVKDEGPTKLWTGGVITMMRASSMNLAMLVTYEETKERLTKFL
jgi:solute carrier family 25 oxoglutarate transporter 11